MNNYVKAANAHFTAVQAEAEAVLETYFNNSVGIGEHSDLPTEIYKWVDKLASAEDALVVLERFKRQQNGKAGTYPENKSQNGRSI
tara:strand:+ start:9831 stop:10088 length:258 start_codon:yes stop_codon:yes gene_type:complete